MAPSPLSAHREKAKKKFKKTFRRVHSNLRRIESLSKYRALLAFPEWSKKDKVSRRFIKPRRTYIVQKRDKNDHPTFHTDLHRRKKFDFSHMRAERAVDIRKYIALPKPGQAKLPKDKLKEILCEEAEKLAVRILRKSTEATNRSMIKCFDELMQSLGEDNEPNPHRALLFLSHMKREGYSTRYISKGVTCLRYHPKLTENYCDISRHPDVRNALANLHKTLLQLEDTRIPLTKSMLEEFEKIVDRDFSRKSALTLKTGLWLGFTCMLRVGELVTSTAVDKEFAHTIPFKLLSFDKKAITITFEGWKLVHHRRTLSFQYIKGSEEKMFSLLTKYSKFRAASA